VRAPLHAWSKHKRGAFRAARVLIETRFGILQCQMKLADTDFNMIVPHGTGLAPRARYSSLGTHKITNTHTHWRTRSGWQKSLSLSPHIFTRALSLVVGSPTIHNNGVALCVGWWKIMRPLVSTRRGAIIHRLRLIPFNFARETKSLCVWRFVPRKLFSSHRD
jgi:hypothetical protein